MISVSFSLMHAPWPSERVDLFRSVVAPAWLREGVSPVVVVDNLRQGIWPTCKRAWEHRDTRCSHHIVLQDDFIPCPGFLGKLRAFIERHPADPLCIFQPADKPAKVKEWMTKGQDFTIPHGAIAWGGSLVLPMPMIDDVISLADNFEWEADDERLTAALWMMGLQPINIGTSIVRHIGAAHFSHTSSDFSSETIEFRAGYVFDGATPS